MSKLIQTRRLLAMVMAVLLIVSLVPVSAFAEMDNGLAGWKGTTVDYNSVDNFYMLQFDGISYGNAEDLVLRPTASTNVQMIRAGKTYTVGAPGNDTFVIWHGGESGYIRVSQYHANLANSGLADGEAAPKQGDVFVVSGDFADKNGNVIITLETTYISVGADDALTFSAEKPATNLGTLRDGKGITSNSDSQQYLYFNSDVTQDGWYCFAPESLDCIKFCRNGVIASVGSSNNGGNEWLRYQGDNGWCIELTSWYLNNARDEAAQVGSSIPDSISMPLQTGDMIIVSGNFKQTGNSDNVVHIDETYFTVGENNSLTITTEKPITNLGTLRDGKGITSNSDSQQYLYFNSDVTQDGWYCFAPESLDCIKFCRNGVIASVGSSNNGGNEWLRYQGDNGWCIELTSWYLNNARDEAAQVGSSIPDSISMPLQAGDVIIVSGNFMQTGNSDNVVHIDKTYFIVGENNSLTITTEEPDISCKHTTTTETTVEPTFTAPGYTAVVCDTCKEELSRTQIAQLSASVQSWNVALSDNIRVNFALTLSVPDVSKAKVRVSVADSVSEYAVSGLPCENGAYSLSVDLAAAQMTDTLSVSFLYGDSTSTETTYSVRDYADRILAGAYSQATKALVREMLSYGGAAQTYFGYHTDRLASDGITGTAETEISTSCDPMSVSGNISGVTYYGASLVYRNRIAVRIYFTGDVSDCTFQIGEQTYAPVQKDGLSYIEVYGILPQNLDDAIALTVSSGDSTLSVTYSPINYIVRMSGKNDENLKNLLKALYNYHLAAQAYLTAPSTIVVEGGTLAEHDDGAELSENMIFVSLADNLLPGNGDDGVTYTAADGVIKLVRGKETVSLSGSIVKYEDGASYELYLEGNVLPMRHNDYLIVEGDFSNTENNYALRISKTYILNINGTLSFATTEPVITEILEAGRMVAAENTQLNGGTGLYFNLTNGSVVPEPTTEDGWLNRFMPKTADTVKLIRDGVTTSIGNVAAGEFVKYSESGYYMDIANWSHPDITPLKAGDVLVFDGYYTNGTVTFKIEKSVVAILEGDTLVFLSEVVDGGHMTATEIGWHGNTVHFAMSGDVSAVPSDSSWKVRYSATQSSNVKLIRNGEIIDTARLDGGQIIAIGNGEFAIGIETWPLPQIGNDGGKDGDILVIEGDFINAENGYVLHVDKTYVALNKTNQTVHFSTGTETDFGEVVLPASADTINYGIWVGSYHLFSDDKLAELKAAGITKLIGIDPQWIGTENSDENGNISMNVFLDRCQKYGITVVAQVRSRAEDGTKYADSWDGTTKPDYADHPALLGFELQDEPMATEFAGLADKKAVLKSFAPDKMVFVNLLPSTSGANSLYGLNVIGKNYEDDYIDAFMEQFEPDVLSWDFYATLSGGKIRKAFFSNFEIMAKKNVTKWYTMLSCGHKSGSSNYDVPTEQELRWQMAVALTYGVSDIDHYTYVSHDTDSNYSCMVEYGTWERTALYDDIEKVDNEYLSWGNIYKAYDYVGTGCVNVNSNQMLKELSNTVSYTEYGISSISTAEDLLVGIFEYEGNHAYMLTNAGKVPYKAIGTEEITMTDTTATIALENSQWYKCVAVISKGEITHMAIGADGTVEIPVGAYEGVFVIPVLN